MTRRSLDQTRFNGRQAALLVVGFFAVVIAVNALMAWLAITSHPGLSSADAYREGRTHNQTLAAAAAQRARGWRVQDRFETGGEGTVRVAVSGQDRGEQVLRGLTGEVDFRHPFKADWDRRLVLRAGSDGELRGTVTLPAVGRWHIRLHLVDGGGRIFRRDREVTVK